MITLLFFCMMIAVFGRLLVIAIRMSWGLLKIAFGIIFAPAVIAVMFACGLLYVAFPLLLIAGAASLLLPGRTM